MGIDLKKSAVLALYFTAAVWVLNYLFGMVFGASVKTLFALTSYPSAIPAPVQPFGASLGNKFLAFLGNYVAIDINMIVLLFISAFLLILAGNFIVNMGAPAVKGKVGKIFSVIAYGTIIGYLLLVGMTAPSMSTLIGVVIYMAAASYLTALLGSVTGQDVA